MSLRRVILSVAAASLGILAGCSSGKTASTTTSSTTASAAVRGACTLITSAQVGQALGETFSAGKQSSALAVNDNCLFDGSNLGDIVGVDAVTGDTASRLMASGKSTLTNISTVSGVGTTAYLEGDGRALVAEKGNGAVDVTITGLSNLTAAQLTTAIESIANTALTALAS